TRFSRGWSSDVCSSDLSTTGAPGKPWLVSPLIGNRRVIEQEAARREDLDAFDTLVHGGLVDRHDQRYPRQVLDEDALGVVVDRQALFHIQGLLALAEELVEVRVGIVGVVRCADAIG